MKPIIRIAATGDSYVTRRLPEQKSESFHQISSVIQQAEVRFTNLEVTTHHCEGYPSALSGGQWAMASPDVLGDLREYGFNLVAWATNHTLDYLYGGLEATEKYLNQYNFVHAGAGMNLATASEPRYLETAAGRVALIAVTSTYHEFQRAGDQRPDMIGRPGIHPLRYSTTHLVTKERLDVLRNIADAVKVNARLKQRIKNGFEVPQDQREFSFGTYQFRESDEEGVITEPHPGDMQRILRRIHEAKRQADYVLVSFHSHDMRGDVWEEPADFLETFSRSCIDEGAHAVIGHGPHILRGIEIYKNRPIFYSLGNFIFQNETLTHLPSDSYELYNLSHDDTVADSLDTKSMKGTRGYITIPEVWETVIPLWTMEAGELKELKLYPVELGFGQPRSQIGTPVLSDHDTVLHKLQKLSEPYGTQIVIDGTVGRVVLD